MIISMNDYYYVWLLENCMCVRVPGIFQRILWDQHCEASCFNFVLQVFLLTNFACNMVCCLKQPQTILKWISTQKVGLNACPCYVILITSINVNVKVIVIGKDNANVEIDDHWRLKYTEV